MTHAELLRGLQKENHFKQKDLARIFGVSEACISKIMHGTRRLGPRKALIAARLLGIPMETFFQ